VGTSAMVSTIYLCEISPTPLRGAITTLNVIAITFGQFASLLICVYLKEDWRMMLLVTGIPSFI
jgi:hypothetical protein